MAKFSVDAYAVGLKDSLKVQFTVTIKVRGSRVTTLQFTSDNNADIERAVGLWFVNRLCEQLDRQQSWYLESDEHPIQMELPRVP